MILKQIIDRGNLPGGFIYGSISISIVWKYNSDFNVARQGFAKLVTKPKEGDSAGRF